MSKFSNSTTEYKQICQQTFSLAAVVTAEELYTTAGLHITAL